MVQSRRTQAERTAATRAALIAATVQTLVDRGYRHTTTTDVARRAGVSPGALLHHFPTKTDLLCAALAHLFDQRLDEFGKGMADLEPGAARADAAVELLWTMFSGPTFTAWLELWVAARTDIELGGPMERLDREFIAASEDVFREVFVEETAANPDLPRLAVGTVFTYLTGLAVSASLPGYEPVPARELLDVFKLLIAPTLPVDPDTTANQEGTVVPT